MSRDEGWYSVRELDQNGNICESNEWVPARFGSTGKWLVAGWSKFDSTKDIETHFELTDHKINPMPATWARSLYAIEKTHKDNISDTQWSLVMHYDTAKSAIKAAMECTRDDGRNVYRAVISTREIRVIGKVE
jgi:hypothetical protein